MNNPNAIFLAISSAPDVLYFMIISEDKEEVKQGKGLISAAVSEGTKYIVMSSIDRGLGGNVLCGVDIWDIKHEIKPYVKYCHIYNYPSRWFPIKLLWRFHQFGLRERLEGQWY